MKMIKADYKNLWHEANPAIMEPVFHVSARVVAQYRDVTVYKVHKERFDYVWKDACITQRTGYKKHKEIIDAVLDGKDEVSSDAVQRYINSHKEVI